MSQSLSALSVVIIAACCLQGGSAWAQGAGYNPATYSAPNPNISGGNPPYPTAASSGANAPAGGADQFAAPAPVMTFLDMYTGQPWGRYVVSESVTVPKYEYQPVTERVWVPTWVQEPKASTVTQYDPVVSYQLRPRSIPSSNPFAPPQQIVEYAPIVQYQPRNVQVNQMTAYQRYEEKEVTRMVPVLVNASEQRSKFVDRPLTASGNGLPTGGNIVQEAAILSQANRTTAKYPTRSIDYPSQPVYGSPVYGYTSSNLAWTTKTMPAPPAVNPASYYASTGTPPIVPISNTVAMPAQQPPANYAATGYPTTYSAPVVPIATPLPASYAGAGTPIPPAMPGTAPAIAGMPYNPYLVPAGTAPTATPGYPATYAAGVPNGVPPSNTYAAGPTMPPNVPPYGQPAYGTPYGYNAPAGYGSPYGYAAPSSGQSLYNQYMAWLSSQGSLFQTNMFAQRGGTASMTTTGGYPYAGYPPGAYPPNPMAVGTVPPVPQLANNQYGVYSSAPNASGRTMAPVSNY